MNPVEISLLDKMLYFEEAILTLPQIEIEPVHRFADGMYAREVTVPKDTLLTGEVHNGTYFTIVSKGDITVIATGSQKQQRIKAPYTFIAQPGVKRVAYAHEETVWTTIHATEIKDIKQVEEAIFDRSYKISDAVRAALKLMPIKMDVLLGFQGDKECLV